MSNGIPLSIGTRITSQSPNDAKYFNDLVPYSSVAEVLSLIPISERHIGLTVNVDKSEFWFQQGIDDSHLILKEKHLTEFNLVPIQNLDEQQVDLVINNYDNVFRLNTFSDDTDLKISIPIGTENFMCYIHLIHKGIQSKEITFINPLISNFSDNTINTNSPVFTIPSNSHYSYYSYITISIYVHKIDNYWNLDYKYNVELTRNFNV